MPPAPHRALLRLAGSAYERGKAQAALCPDQADFVRTAIATRIDETRDALGRQDVQDLIAGIRAYTELHYPEILEEIRGIGDGFGIDPARIFTYLNCSHAMDVLQAEEPRVTDGCTALAVSRPSGGATLAKNRDYRPEHIPIQRVSHHANPAWRGRSFLCIGSLGSPGNFSSGMNSDGLAVADTASRTVRHAPGMHRYFLLTWLLVHCRLVEEALAAIRSMPHAGSGLLVLADRHGDVAAVELGTTVVGVDRGTGGRVGRSNHFVLPETLDLNLETPGSKRAGCNSVKRLERLRERLAEALPDFRPREAIRILSAHGTNADGFCRHGAADLSHTISCAVYDTAALELFFAPGNPCAENFDFHEFPPSSSPDARREEAPAHLS